MNKFQLTEGLLSLTLQQCTVPLHFGLYKAEGCSVIKPGHRKADIAAQSPYKKTDINVQSKFSLANQLDG